MARRPFEFYGELCGRQASEAIGSFAKRHEQGSRATYRRTPSSSFITAARAAPMLAAITDPLTVALGGAKQLPNQASQWQGWSVTDLRTDGGWRRGSLVVNGDGLGADEVALAYACEYEGQARRAPPCAAGRSCCGSTRRRARRAW